MKKLFYHILLLSFICFIAAACHTHPDDPLEEDARTYAREHCHYLSLLKNADGNPERFKEIEQEYNVHQQLNAAMKKKYPGLKQKQRFYKIFNEEVQECEAEEKEQ